LTLPSADAAEREGERADVTVSIVVVNYNGADGLERCVRALVDGAGRRDIEVLVVDNASSDGSDDIAERLAAELGSVKLLRSETNRGYAGAVNLALAQATGTYLAVLNMDVVVAQGWLDPLVSLLDAHPDAGVACPLILLESDQGRINAAGQDLNKTGLGYNRWLGEPREVAGTDPFEVDGLHGAAFVIRRSLLDQLGGWDASGFLYFEDVELSWLLRIAGARIWCVPGSTVSHDYHLSMFPEKLFLLERNRWKMLLADLHRLTRLALSPLLALTELMVWAYCLVRGPKFLSAKRRSYGWVRAHGPLIRERREQVDVLRRRSDWEVVRGLRWGYPLDQFRTIGRERGDSARDRIGH
jgi:GT2 family glycosyltransferase